LNKDREKYREKESRLDDVYRHDWQRKTDSDWKNSGKAEIEFAKGLVKNNSDHRLGFSSIHDKPEAPKRILAREEEEPEKNIDRNQGSLYDRTVERMNHKNLFNKTMEGKKQREGREPVNFNIPVNPARNSATKQSYLLNDSFERNHPKRNSNDISYNNYMGDKRVGNLIRKPKNDNPEPPIAGKSKLKTNIMKRILAEELEPTDQDFNKRHEGSRYSGSHARDYSLEMYKKQLNTHKEKNEDIEALREKLNKSKTESRGDSRSISRSVNKKIDISNDRINVGKLLDYYRGDPFE
jgi:hypothetical protein